ncbi:UNVERIFIED_CONTAM: hypothetical protein Sradi_1876800 [Sesamum radiatum]|uniref:Uncharacterized protein n=1 Tax=Sesamum radiatum TaxID=300843 RepID=A0AAW2TXY1_SESRA
MQEKKIALCYIIAYEPLWDELCSLFEEDGNKIIIISDDEDATGDLFGWNAGWVDPPLSNNFKNGSYYKFN